MITPDLIQQKRRCLLIAAATPINHIRLLYLNVAACIEYEEWCYAEETIWLSRGGPNGIPNQIIFGMMRKGLDAAANRSVYVDMARWHEKVSRDLGTSHHGIVVDGASAHEYTIDGVVAPVDDAALPSPDPMSEDSREEDRMDEDEIESNEEDRMDEDTEDNLEDKMEEDTENDTRDDVDVDMG
ncbi:hypothetical protein ABW19_dt0205269 [Dactylella cylindrospora]|nr:hypothetical protein ABW19_dt0205269 [Dactylella cylindrospora]